MYNIPDRSYTMVACVIPGGIRAIASSIQYTMARTANFTSRTYRESITHIHQHTKGGNGILIMMKLRRTVGSK